MNHRLNDFEQIENDFYEMKPYLFTTMAGLCFYFKGQSNILIGSGVLFLISGVCIFYLRYFARNK